MRPGNVERKGVRYLVFLIVKRPTSPCKPQNVQATSGSVFAYRGSPEVILTDLLGRHLIIGFAVLLL